MTIWVFRDGELVEKHTLVRGAPLSDLPTPMISRMEPFLSPVTEKEITSWRERDRDMRAVDAVDRRDLPKDHVFSRGREEQAKEVGKGTENAWR